MKLSVDKYKAKQVNSLTKSLLEVKGISMEDWLYEQQLAYVTANSDLLIKALNTNKKGE